MVVAGPAEFTQKKKARKKGEKETRKKKKKKIPEKKNDFSFLVTPPRTTIAHVSVYCLLARVRLSLVYSCLVYDVPKREKRYNLRGEVSLSICVRRLCSRESQSKDCQRIINDAIPRQVRMREDEKKTLTRYYIHSICACCSEFICRLRVRTRVRDARNACDHASAQIARYDYMR